MGRDLTKKTGRRLCYNPKFIVTQEDIEQLTGKVELLRDITSGICQKKIEEYDQLAKQK